MSSLHETAKTTVEHLTKILEKVDSSELNDDLQSKSKIKESIQLLINEKTGLLTLFPPDVGFFKKIQQGFANVSLGLNTDQLIKSFTGDERIKLQQLRLTAAQIERLTRRNSKVLPDNLSPSSFKHDDDDDKNKYGDTCIRINGIDSTGAETYGCLSQTGNFFFQDNSDPFNYRNFHAVKKNGTNEETYLILGTFESIPEGYTEIKHDYNQVRNIAGGKRRTRRNRKCNNTKKCRNQKKFRSRRH